MIFINFKSTKNGVGTNAVRLVTIIDEVSNNSALKIVPVVQELDAYSCRNVYDGEMWLQHADAEEGTTGRTSIAVISNVGDSLKIGGVFLNHSEHKYHKFDALKKTVKDCEKHGIGSLVFASDIRELEKVIKLKPEYLAFEPPELVGSKETSVAKSKPDEIKKAAEICKKFDTPLIVGAGIKDRKDVEVSLKMGAQGVAASSAVVKADDPEEILEELVSGFGK